MDVNCIVDHYPRVQGQGAAPGGEEDGGEEEEFKDKL
jgi:hypothetical protein